MIDPSPETTRRAPSWENWVMIMILSLVATVQINAVIHGGSIGQDFGLHARDVRNAVNEPIKWLFGSFQRTSPPLYHWLVSFIFRWCDAKGWVLATGFVSAVAHAFALWVLKLIGDEVISDPVMRIAALAFIAFLPVSIITPVVLATDALNQLPFVGLLYALVLWVHRPNQRRLAVALYLVCTLILVSNKYIALALIPATWAVLAVATRGAHLKPRTALLAGAIYALWAGAPPSYWILQHSQNVTDHFAQSAGTPEHLPEPMNIRSLVFFRAGDVSLLRAPGLFDLARPERPDSLSKSNYFSFPGLAIYGIFSDSINIFQTLKNETPSGSGFSIAGKRTAWTQAAMEIAVKTGAGITIILSIIFTLTGAHTIRRFYRAQDDQNSLLVSFGLLGFAWLGFIMAILPLTPRSYLWGYWTPRLYLPAIWTLALLAFCGIEQAFKPWRGRRIYFLGRLLLLATVLAQSALHVSFLWPVDWD